MFNGFDTSNLSVGQHTLWVGADNLGQTIESDETNNWRSITFDGDGAAAGRPRSEQPRLWALPRWCRVRHSASSTTIVNDGAAQSNAGYASFYIDGLSEAYFRGRNFIDPLGVGASRTVFLLDREPPGSLYDRA